MDEFEIDWIPEDTGAPYEADEWFLDIPAHTIDKYVKLSLDIQTGPEWARWHQQI